MVVDDILKRILLNAGRVFGQSVVNVWCSANVRLFSLITLHEYVKCVFFTAVFKYTDHCWCAWFRMGTSYPNHCLLPRYLFATGYKSACKLCCINWNNVKSTTCVSVALE